MFSKILVANRGEIAIRAFRAGYELGAKTVAVFPHEDRNSIHRQKADEAYLIGEPGHPVRAYLDVDEIIRVAKESGADAIYPGYGFLSENPRSGVRPPGPASPSSVRRPTYWNWPGNKVHALEAARKAGDPGAEVQRALADLDELLAEADEIGFPIFVKAVAGGGGRGMRRVDTREGPAGSVAGRHARSRHRLRRPNRVPGAGRAAAAPHRGADPGRRGRATSCTSSSAIARSSAATRRSSKSPRHRTSTRTSARRCTGTQ